MEKRRFSVDNRKNAEFHSIFKDIPDSEILAADYVITIPLQKLIRYSGSKLFITLNYLCLYNLEKKNEQIPFADIIAIDKLPKNVFSNPLAITIKDGKQHTFSVAKRDEVYNHLVAFWKNSISSNKLSLHELMSQIDVSVSDSESVFSDDDTITDDTKPTSSLLSDDMVLVSGPKRRMSMYTKPLRPEGEEVEMTEAKFSETEEKKKDDKEKDKETIDKTDINEEELKNMETTDISSSGYKPLKTALVDVIINHSVWKIHSWIFSNCDGDFSRFWPKFLKTTLGFKDLEIDNWKSENSQEIRQYRYVMELRQSMGPKATRVINTQQYFQKDPKKGIFVIENVSETPDVPMSDSFRTVSQYCLSHVKGGKCRLILTGEIRFLKSTWLKSVIESHSIDGLLQFSKSLVSHIEKTYAVNQESLLGENVAKDAAAGGAATAASTSGTSSSEETSKDKENLSSSSWKFNYSDYERYIHVILILLLLLIANLIVYIKLSSAYHSLDVLESEAISSQRYAQEEAKRVVNEQLSEMIYKFDQLTKIVSKSDQACGS